MSESGSLEGGVGGPIRFRGSSPEILYMPAIVPEEFKNPCLDFRYIFKLRFQFAIACLASTCAKVDLVSLRVLA